MEWSPQKMTEKNSLGLPGAWGYNQPVSSSYDGSHRSHLGVSSLVDPSSLHNFYQEATFRICTPSATSSNNMQMDSRGNLGWISDPNGGDVW